MPTQQQPNIELRSEEIQELLARVPSSILRWGITALFFCLLLAFAAACLVKLPERIRGNFALDSSHKGIIEIPIESSGMVQVGQVIAVELDNYPSAKFGKLKTTVDSMAYDYQRETYVVYTPDLSNLETTFGQELQALPVVTGRASITVEEQAVIKRLLPFIPI